MKLMQLPGYLKAIALVCLVGGLADVSGFAPAAATSAPELLMARSPRQRLNFRVGVRPSRYRIGGYSRAGSCSNQPLTALVPPPRSQENLPRNQITVDQTISDHPGFFVHLPTLPVAPAEFLLQDEKGNELYSFMFNPTGKAGIVGVMLPDDAPALKVGQKYFWLVTVSCDTKEASKVASVGSWVERVKSPTNRDKDQLATLAEQGIWQDVLTTLAVQRFQKPSDRTIADDWAMLMEDAGLPQFKRTDIVQIVKNNPPEKQQPSQN